MTGSEENRINEGYIERIHARALEAKNLDDLALVLRDAGEAILWLHSIASVAIGRSLYLEGLEAATMKDAVNLHRWLRSDSFNVHFRDQGDKAGPVRASEGNSKQLDAALAALNALYCAQWNLRTAAEVLRPGIEYDGERSHHLS